MSDLKTAARAALEAMAWLKDRECPDAHNGFAFYDLDLDEVLAMRAARAALEAALAAPSVDPAAILAALGDGL